MSPVAWDELANEVGNVFTPAASIQTKDFFAGRLEQLRLIGETIRERGRHAIVALAEEDEHGHFQGD